jgi:hypothetical protein
MILINPQPKEPNTMNQSILKTVNIRGKEYTLVESRIAFFNQSNPRGSIRTEIIGQPQEWVFVRALVTPDVEKPERVFTGHSQAKWVGSINGQSALENAESSAIGRALAAMGLGGGASYDEMLKCGAASSDDLMVRTEDNKVVKIDPPISNYNGSKAIEMIEKWLITNPKFTGADLVDFLISTKKYEIDPDDVLGEPARLPEKVLQDVASKLSKLSAHLGKFKANKAK